LNYIQFGGILFLWIEYISAIITEGNGAISGRVNLGDSFFIPLMDDIGIKVRGAAAVV